MLTFIRRKWFTLPALSKYTAKAIKDINPAYRVGGPATAGNGWIDETIQFTN